MFTSQPCCSIEHNCIFKVVKTTPDLSLVYKSSSYTSYTPDQCLPHHHAGEYVQLLRYGYTVYTSPVFTYDLKNKKYTEFNIVAFH